MDTWTYRANQIFDTVRRDSAKLKEHLNQMKAIILENDESDESENPFIALIDKEVDSLNTFLDEFQSV
jgi:hypothetical protein